MKEESSADAREPVIPTYANEQVLEEPARRIGQELYHDAGYDAIWRLSNCGFVLRLNTTYIFFDPILTSPLPSYVAHRKRVEEGGEHPYRLELKYHDRPENVSKEIHTLPLYPEEIEKADYVMLSHEHADHFDLTGLQRLAHLNPTIVAPKSCQPELKEIGYPERRIVEAGYGETREWNEFSVRIVPASHHGCTDACGYLLNTRHGNIYFHGDGRFDHKDKEEVVGLDVDYLLLPINDTNLGVGFAALLTHLLQPRVVIPCHYGYIYPALRHQGGHPAEFVTALAARNYKIPSTDIMILSPGGRLILA